MKQTFEVLNVKCGGCASTLTKSLKVEFGEIEVSKDFYPALDEWIDTVYARADKKGKEFLYLQLKKMIFLLY